MNNIEQNVDQETINPGLIGYYFEDDAFQNLLFIHVGEQNPLIQKAMINPDIQKVHSIRWIGRIKIYQTGPYTLTTQLTDNVVIQVHKQIIWKQGESSVILLEKNKIYDIVIEFRGNAKAFSKLPLFYTLDASAKKELPNTAFLFPDFSVLSKKPKGSDSSYFPKYNLIDDKRKQTNNIVPLDTDNDGITDEFELNGYTFKNQEIVPWDATLEGGQYKKYVSNPYRSHTVADPYTDFEKVAGLMPTATKIEARDPLVAAYPAVSVAMETLLFSKNEDVSAGNTGTQSKSVTNTDSGTTTVELSTELSFNPFAIVKATPKISNSWTKSTAVQNTDTSSWSSQIGINTAESAYLNANVRYYNTGTSPIYNLKPTTNFVLQNSDTSIATITAGPNQIGNSLGPGATYPALNLAPISLDKANEAGAVKISINKETLDLIQINKEILSLETTQNKGSYGTLNESGTLVISGEWEPIRTDIDTVCGVLILNNFNDQETLERRVGAKNPVDPEDLTPRITIQEAIQKAFYAEKTNGKLFYRNGKNQKKCIDESAVMVYIDEYTKSLLEAQFKGIPEEDQKIYEATWEIGMKIMISLPTIYFDFEDENNTGWNSIRLVDNAYTGVKGAGTLDKTYSYTKPLPPFDPYTTYGVKAYLKSNTPNAHEPITIYVKNQEDGSGDGAKKLVSIEKGKWSVLEYFFNTGSHPENYKYLGIKTRSSGGVTPFDDISLSKIRNNPVGESIIKNGDFSEGIKYWNYVEVIDGYARALGIPSQGFASMLSDNFEIKGKTKYILEFDLRLDPAVSKSDVFITMAYPNGSAVFFNTLIPAQREWTRHRFEVFASWGDTDAQFRAEDYRFDTKTFNITNITLYELLDTSDK
ncbi:binary toxin-like calcium binding domain-containing protein [Bacillus paranthracis]|uniref:Iota toxin protein Ib n=1 Tax=Bacillus paranthracis TaxID=2026186 RepID=A0AAJ1KAG7_9BACI|nr:binary toxin-like calcium binding domain-containing protein [Bacillus paranthracis]MDG0949992.1 Iota toxin protein Ib [Bacillus paranthracis]MDG0955889.1 Iota toxin protein Ib [Bacillus paranthracis]